MRWCRTILPFKSPGLVGHAAGDTLGARGVRAGGEGHNQMPAHATLPVLEGGRGIDDAGEASAAAMPDIGCAVTEFAQGEMHGFERRGFIADIEGCHGVGVPGPRRRLG